MRPIDRKLLLIIAVLSFALPFSAGAQLTAECPAGSEDFARSLDAIFKERVKTEIPDIVEAAIRDTPRFAARSQQDSTPSASGGGATLIDEAQFTSLLSAAFDQMIGSESDDDNEGLTLNLSPFTMAVAYDSDVFYDQERYQRTEYEWMRRVNGALSLGGRGESFDRNGDGMADEALGAKALDDIVTWELRVRFWGSRDRRNRSNYEPILDRLTTQEDALLAQVPAVLPNLLLDPRVLGYQIPRTGCIESGRWDELVGQAWFKEFLAANAEALVGANFAYREALREVDNGLLLTAVLTGVEREKQFGPDKLGAGLRGSWSDFTLNFDWMTMDSTVNKSEVDEFKVGLQWARPVLKDLVGKDGVDVSLGVAVEIFDDSPDVKHDTTVKVQGKLEIPIPRMEGVTLPISLTWANHEDLLSKDDQVIGRIGINVDTAKLLDLVRGER